MAPYVYDVSREGDSDSVESEEKSFCAPSRNRTGDLLLMRRGWYHKTIASAQPLAMPRRWRTVIKDNKAENIL
jgi:hypothetical protein